MILQDGDSLFWCENHRPGWGPRQLIDPFFLDSEIAWLEELDLDLDGDLDLLQAPRPFDGPSTIAWDENVMHGTEWRRHVITQTVSWPGDMQQSYGDLDGDGDVDLVIPSLEAGMILWFENVVGDSIWPEHVVGALPARWSTVADLDGDLDLDIAARGEGAPGVVWFENRWPDPAWVYHGIGIVVGRSWVGDCADLDGDGDQDVVTHDTGSLFYFANPSWDRIPITTTSNAFLGRIGDLDGDMDLDVTFGGTGLGSGDIGWVENLGAGTSWIRHDVDTTSAKQRIASGLADVDGDDDTDIVGLTFDVDTAIGSALWYRNPQQGSGVDASDVTAGLWLTPRPNPFRDRVRLDYGVREGGTALLRIFDARGRLLYTFQPRAASGSLPWDGRDRDGSKLASGIYLLELSSGSRSAAQRVLLLR